MKAALLLLAACGSGSQHSTIKMTFSADEPAAALAHASHTADVAAVRHMLADTVVDGGLWFADADCARDFAAPNEITGPRLDVFAACLAKLSLQTTKQHEQTDDLALMTYAPGIEVEARLGGKRLRWIGFAGVRGPTDHAPALTAEALEALRDAGVRTPAAPQNTWAWIRVCIDPMGDIASTSVRGASTLEDARAYEAAARAWHFRPFMLGGQPQAACAMVALTTRPKNPMRPPPFATPNGEPFLSPTLHELANGGSTFPPFGVMKALHQNGVDRLFINMMFCVNEHGEVYGVRMLRASGVPSYDQQLMHVYETRRFEPYRDGGKPVAFCTEEVHVLDFTVTP